MLFGVGIQLLLEKLPGPWLNLWFTLGNSLAPKYSLLGGKKMWLWTATKIVGISKWGSYVTEITTYMGNVTTNRQSLKFVKKAVLLSVWSWDCFYSLSFALVLYLTLCEDLLSVSVTLNIFLNRDFSA